MPLKVSDNLLCFVFGCLEFEGSYFLWGVFRPNNVKKEASSSKSMIVHEIYGQKGVIDSQGSTCADFPPGFERIQKLPPQS